ncbi:hypothetical protein PFNF135_06144, partial [Plasmodium falciparum NF135/5.C10]
MTPSHCRCGNGDVTIVPTYFDYVPQFLRWFEEWAEDFCRLRKHKLQNAIQKCRGKNGKDKYCSGNGYDCEQTIRGDEHFVEGECHKCSVVCTPFRQKRSIRSGSDGNKYDGYEKNFYEQLKKSGYGTVNKFLQLLNNETTCTKNSDIEDGGQIDFKTVKSSSASDDGSNKTFYRTTYCEACPWCGAEKDNSRNGGWKAKDDKTCGEGRDYTNYKDTEIPILTGDKTKDDMVKKYNKFCNGNGGNGAPAAATGTATSGGKGEKGHQMEKWKCYYYKKNEDGSEDINFCVLQNNETGTSKKNSMHYNAFFWKWVHDMLMDSIEWRTQLGNCINKDKGKTCITGCKKKCDCFLKWVNEKKTEWTNIKKHFYKQEGFDNEGDKGIPVGGGFGFTHDFVLDELLKKDLLLKIIKETYGNAYEIKHIEELLKETGVLGGGKDNTTIDKLLKHEGDDATKCLEKHKDPCPQQEVTRLRSETNEENATPRSEEDGNPSDEEDEDEDEVEEEAESKEEEDEDRKEESPKETTKEVNPCDIVSKLFQNPNDFSDACTLKYGKTAPTSWKCVPTTSGDSGVTATDSESERHSRAKRGAEHPTKSGDATGGSVCVPPRRRRLYVGKLETLDTDSTSQNDVKTASQPDPLLKAFVESAAIETFFAWHKYKEEKKPQNTSQLLQTTVNGSSEDDENNPEKLLQKGEIPEEFLRQMFYTLGDYRDICVGKTPDGIDTVIVSSSGGSVKDIKSETSSKETDMQKIKKAIDSVFNSGNNQESGSSRSPSVEKTTRESWWKEHAESIWNGMIYALTYNTDSGGKTIEKDETADYTKLWDNNNNKPQNSQYQYNSVTLKEEDESGGGPKPQNPTASGDNNPPKLTDFVLRPPYFRYLEEWGQNFCKERKKRLAQIKVECKVDKDGPKSGNKKCSCYGEDCKTIFSQKYDILPDLECRTCGEECTKYKKWINTKKTQYEKQEKAYIKQKDKCVNGSNKGGGNGVCGIPEKGCDTAAEFLEKLVPCSKTYNDNGEDNKINFNDKEKTFGPSPNCKPCSQFTVDCKNGKCKSSLNGKCQGKITVDTFDTMGEEPQEVVMRVSDNDTNKNGFGDLKDCENAGIFTGIKENKYKCGNFCGYVVCKSENGNTETGSEKKNDGKHIITIRALVTHWIQYFLEDYNRIKHKISHCKNSSEGYTCINGCVEQWIEKKRDEWKKIKEHYQKQYGDNDSNNSFSVRTVLEEFKDRPEFNKAIKPCGSLTDFESSCGLNGDESSKKSKNSNDNDLVKCLFNKLEEKIKTQSCPPQASDDTPATCGGNTPPDDEEPLEETEENTEEAKKNMIPKICEGVIKPEPEVDEGKCEEDDKNVDGEKDEKSESEEGKDTSTSSGEGQDGSPTLPGSEAAEKPAADSPLPSTPSARPNPEQTPPAPAPAAPPSPPTKPQPLPSDNTSDILKTTIPFGIALALTSIALLFLK